MSCIHFPGGLSHTRHLKYHKLPTGNYTTNLNYYLKSWHKLAKRICHHTGWRLSSFDPDLIFFNKYGDGIILPSWAAIDLVKNICK